MNDIIILDGNSLTIEAVKRIARDKVTVEICEGAMERIYAGRRLVYEFMDSDVPVYGFNRGVGWNKDRKVVAKYYEEYNRNLIYSHCVAVKPEAKEEIVRATILARLNTFLVGCTGIQPEIVTLYKEMLNKDVLPVIPERGSIGQADITCLSHIGLAIMGEGEVNYKGVRMSADDGLKEAGLKPVVLGPKDGLAIVSSNGLVTGTGALLAQDIEDLVDLSDIIYSLSMEGFKGNVSPLDESAYKVRPQRGQSYSAERVRKYLEGSYLWLPNVSEALQDPLCFRGSCQVHGSVRDALEFVKEYLLLQLNTSEDNPCMLLEEKRMIPCSNYEITTLALAFEMMGLALSHLSRNSCYRTIKLSNPYFTGLSRFLTPADTSVLAFGTIQKTFTSLDAEIRHLSNPVTADYFSLAGDIEDHASNGSIIVQKTAKIIDNIRYILGIEAIHAVQAIDLRKADRLGKGTRIAYEIIRSEIPFLDKDRNLSIDIQKAYELIQSNEILTAVKKSLNLL